MVNFLRAQDYDLDAIDLSGEPRRLQTQELVEGDVSQVWHPRCREFLASRKVRKERGIDPHTEFTALLDDAKARRSPWLKSRHSNRCDAWQRTDCGSDNDFGGLRESLGEFNTHLEAHSINQKIRDRLRP